MAKLDAHGIKHSSVIMKHILLYTLFYAKFDLGVNCPSVGDGPETSYCINKLIVELRLQVLPSSYITFG